ncbi:MAG: penicillin-insensitive murein endopeptidase [Pseudomonadota bacterium]
MNKTIWLGLMVFVLSFIMLIPAHSENTQPAKKLFGAIKQARPVAARSFGSYVKGCLAGGRRLAINGPAWQAMRLSRNRNWGHPKLVSYVERLATDSKNKDRWPGLLVGDLSQPHGGPMLTGHRSHQIGLDADIWFYPMPRRRLTQAEREKISAISMLSSNKLSVNSKVWKPGHVHLLKRAVSYPEVARVFVHPAIKKALCRATRGQDQSWLRRIRPWWGHHYHFHVRLKCPAESSECQNQPEPGDKPGCGKELDYWYKLLTAKPKKPKKPVKKKKRRPLQLADLPRACSTLVAPNLR